MHVKAAKTCSSAGSSAPFVDVEVNYAQKQLLAPVKSARMNLVKKKQEQKK